MQQSHSIIKKLILAVHFAPIIFIPPPPLGGLHPAMDTSLEILHKIQNQEDSLFSYTMRVYGMGNMYNFLF